MGATSAAASAGHARCLVRALCLLLRKVSLHALLQGAEGGAGATPSGGLDGAGVEVDAAEVIHLFSFFSLFLCLFLGSTGRTTKHIGQSTTAAIGRVRTTLSLEIINALFEC